MDASPPEAGLRVLVAEDNAINRELVRRVLTKQGHDVAVVGDGREAVERIETAEAGFDLVLMDVQMPRMDGVAAAAAIRALERDMERRTPIVALTAHAREGDRERFLDGTDMDGYLPKPIDVARLLEVIAAVVEGGSLPAVEPTAVPPGCLETGDCPVDWPRALENVDGDEELLRDLVGVFLDAEPAMLDDVKQAVAAEDGPRLERAAHRVAGSVGNFAAGKAVQKADALELTGERRRWADAEAGLHALEKALADVRRALERILSGCS